MGHRVMLACIGGYTFEEQARGQNIEILTSLTMDRRLYLPNLWSDYKQLRQLVLDKAIDIVHTHLLHDNWMAGLALRNLGKPHLLLRTMHRFDMPRSDPFHKWLFTKQTDHLITTSESMKERIVQRLSLNPEHVDVVFGGVDLNRFNPQRDPSIIRRERGIPLDAPVVGIVARLRGGRGHHWLLEAFPRVLRQIPQAHLIVVGRGELKYPLREQVAAMAEADHIHMIGYRSDDLPEAFAAMNASLFLGQGSEGTCRAILEAMACGRPVIGVDEGGVKEIVRHGETGLVVAKDDVEGLASAMVEMLSDTEKAKRLGAESRLQCENRFTETKRADDVMRIYEKVWAAKFGG